MNTTIKRGPWLTTFLIVKGVITCIMVYSCIFSWHIVITIFPAWIVLGTFIIEILMLASLTAIWFWSRTGVISLVLMLLLGRVFSIISTLQLGSWVLLLFGGVKFIILFLVELIILLLILRPKWGYMKWGLSTQGQVDV